jgi:hypothetical protein
MREISTSTADLKISPLVSDGGAMSARVLAGMWTRWMHAAATNAESSSLASTTLKPYAHQTVSPRV